MDRVAVETASVVVLCDGASTQDIANKRGHLFESFVAQLLSTQGYENALSENLNVTSEGIEIDVTATHRVTGDRVICECKAYSDPIRAPHLKSFLGTFALARADDSQIRGLFVGLPRLGPNALEKAKAAEEKLPGFKYLGSFDVVRLLTSAGLLPLWEEGPALKADPTVVVTEHGVVLSASELDPVTRQASGWAVWSRGGLVPEPIVSLVDRYLSRGLPVRALGRAGVTALARPQPAVSLVEVAGSRSDFEYQRPAAPPFFVGRKTLALSLAAEMLQRQRGGCLVINAKSGWGKSSLALRLKDAVERDGGYALVVDARTAESPEFVVAALVKAIRAAEDKAMIELSDDAVFTTLHSTIESLKSARWTSSAKPVYLAFDQFESVFKSTQLTKEFRDLALLIGEVEGPITVGFSWKTDYMAWAEDYPFQLRNDIRDSSVVMDLKPFGPREIEALFRRLEKSLGAKLNRELRGQLREHSYNLPWLFKKLGGHVIEEVANGVPQEELANQALNIQRLFERDLSRLSPSEESALRTISHSAPISYTDLSESLVSSGMLDSLIHQRLVVQVGDKVDTYWDTFRDFLNTGSVASEDSYMLRYPPLGAGRLLRIIEDAGGSISVADAADRLNTSTTVVFNYSRELKMFGVLKPEVNQLVIEADIRDDDDKEEQIRVRVAAALRRHKMYKLVMEILSRDGTVRTTNLARLLPLEFPSVDAKSDSWAVYARSFCQWLDYAGLVRLHQDLVTQTDAAQDRKIVCLLTDEVPTRVRGVFPRSSPSGSLNLLRHLSAPTRFPRSSGRLDAIAIRDLTVLGLLHTDSGGRLSLRENLVVSDGEVDVERLRTAVEQQPGLREAFETIRSNPAVSPRNLGLCQKEQIGADWSDATVVYIGKFIRAWARACGLATSLREKPASTSQPTLDL